MQLYNLLMVEQIPMKNIDQVHWAKLFNAIDPTLEKPSSNFADSNFFIEAHRVLQKQESMEKFIPVIAIYAIQIDSEIFFFAAALTHSGTYYKLNSFTASKDDDFELNIADFTDRCVEAAKRKFKLTVTIIIYDFFKAVESTYVQQESEGILKCVSLKRYIDEIKTKGLFITDPTQAAEKCVMFHEFLSEMDNEVTKHNISMAEAAHNILTAIEKKTITMQDGWDSLLKKYISPVMVGCTFLHPQFKLDLLNKHHEAPFEDVNFMLNEFINTSVPAEAHEMIAEYKLEGDIFDYCKRKKIYNPKKYWEVLKSSCPLLAKVSLDAAVIPASLLNLDLKALYNLRKTYSTENIDRIEYEYNSFIILNKNRYN